MHSKPPNANKLNNTSNRTDVSFTCRRFCCVFRMNCFGMWIGHLLSLVSFEIRSFACPMSELPRTTPTTCSQSASDRPFEQSNTSTDYTFSAVFLFCANSGIFIFKLVFNKSARAACVNVCDTYGPATCFGFYFSIVLFSHDHSIATDAIHLSLRVKKNTVHTTVSCAWSRSVCVNKVSVERAKLAQRNIESTKFTSCGHLSFSTIRLHHTFVPDIVRHTSFIREKKMFA